MNANKKSRKAFLLRLDKETWVRLKHLSEYEDTSMSYFVRKLLRLGLNRLEKKTPIGGRS